MGVGMVGGLCDRERMPTTGSAPPFFLSCLCGSERARSARGRFAYFLSCLCGSEHGVGVGEELQIFLSCLCGSELDFKSSIWLIFKELRVKQGEHPNFWSVA